MIQYYHLHYNVNRPCTWWIGPASLGTDGHVTIAIEMDRGLVSAAWCSPKDNFSRARGRFIANARLMASPLGRRYPRNFMPPDTELKGIEGDIQLAEAALKSVMSSYIPPWFMGREELVQKVRFEKRH